MEKYSRIKALISLDAIRYNFEQMKKQAADFICGRYNWNDIAARTIELYREALMQKG